MELQINVHILLLVSLCSAQYFYPVPMYKPSLSKPERFPELGLTPRYQDLVLQYISGMAGRSQSPQVSVFPTRIEDFGISGGPALPDIGAREPVTDSPLAAAAAPLQPSHLLPSDFVLLATSPQSQFFGHVDVVTPNKGRQGVEESAALPPIGGSLSNFLIQRENNDNKVKRQTFGYSNDVFDEEEVVINAAEHREAEESSSSVSNQTSSNCNNTNTNSESTTEKEEPEPSVAQSKPVAIALAGAGGVAQAAPVATALVGKNGLAIAAPSATAIAGKGSQAALGGEEKSLRRIATTGSEKKKAN